MEQRAKNKLVWEWCGRNVLQSKGKKFHIRFIKKAVRHCGRNHRHLRWIDLHIKQCVLDCNVTAFIQFDESVIPESRITWMSRCGQATLPTSILLTIFEEDYSAMFPVAIKRNCNEVPPLALEFEKVVE